MSELASMSKAESNRTKAVLSRQVDRFRAPYDRFVMEHPRQCVFIGTTNSVDGYFKDPTGSRRFWPVACKSIDRDAIINDRAQLWAEAVVRFERGEIWWLEGSEIRLAMDQQAARDESDPWEMAVTTYVSGRTVVTSSEILSNQLEMKISDQGRLDEMRVTAVLTKLGWWKKRVMKDGDRKWTWYSPTYQEEFNDVGQDVGQEF
jgi:putative DNA primase/helicase